MKSLISVMAHSQSNSLNFAFVLLTIITTVIGGTSVMAQEKSPMIWAVQMEQFERRLGDENERLSVWNGDAFVGNDDFRVRWLSEGEFDNASSSFEKLQNQFVAQVPISTFFDAKAGLRIDTPKGPDRWYATAGVSGLAPQWVEIDADIFLSEDGDLSARLDAEYELLLTNWLILTPSADVEFAFSDDREVGIGSGLSSAELGVRLSYDLVERSISPYVGVVYERKFGSTASLAQDENEDAEGWLGVLGLKMVF